MRPSGGATVLMVVAVLAVAGGAGAQEPAAAPSPAPSAAPTPAPTPHPALQGANLDTLRALSTFFTAEMQHAVDGIQGTGRGGRAARLFVTSSRMLWRRSQAFGRRLETYRTQPFDVAAEVAQMARRAEMIQKRMRTLQAFPHTWEDWDAAQDALARMQKLLAGEKVAVPPPHTPRPIPTGIPPLLRAPDPAPAPSASPPAP